MPVKGLTCCKGPRGQHAPSRRGKPSREGSHGRYGMNVAPACLHYLMHHVLSQVQLMLSFSSILAHVLVLK